MLSTTLALLVSWHTLAQNAPGDVVAPFVSDEVAVIVHANLPNMDLKRDVRALLGDNVSPDELLGSTGETIETLKNAGVSDIFVLIDPLEMPGLPLIIVPARAGTEPLKRALAGLLPADIQPPPIIEAVPGAVLVGLPEAIARARQPNPPRPNLDKALASAGDAPVRMIVIPSQTQRRAINESMPTLPEQLGGGPTSAITQGLAWLACSLHTKPEPSIQIVAQAVDPEAAQTLAQIAGHAFKSLQTTLDDKNPLTVSLKVALGQMKPELRGDQIVLRATAQSTLALAAQPILAARQAARRTACMNNLKQIGLAFHVYHDHHNTFPPAYSASKDGKPLLSWRVHILPFINQEELYKQFHLEEPWDSPHNVALLKSIPMIYVCTEDASLFKEGKTTYLAPVGPGLAMTGAAGAPVRSITDGLSNTIFVIDASPSIAVPWTKPADWEPANPIAPADLESSHPNGFHALFADGVVRFLETTIDSKLLRALVTPSGGEVVTLP